MYLKLERRYCWVSVGSVLIEVSAELSYFIPDQG